MLHIGAVSIEEHPWRMNMDCIVKWKAPPIKGHLLLKAPPIKGHLLLKAPPIKGNFCMDAELSQNNKWTIVKYFPKALVTQSSRGCTMICDT